MKDFPIVKLTRYDNSDYELLTKKHLPRAQWETGLKELEDNLEKLEEKGSICEKFIDQLNTNHS